MRPSRVAWVVLLGPPLLPGWAWAAEGQLTASTTIVPGVSTPAVTVPTDTGSVPISGESDPTLRFGLGGRLSAAVGDQTRVSAAWGLYRIQALCDTCASGQGPGWLGSELLGSTDLGLQVAHTVPLGDAASLVLSGGAQLPASRSALSCNPMYAAPGVGATFQLPARGSSFAIGVSARRPLYRFDAAPVGRCAPELRDATVTTLTGPVEATAWAGEWFGAANPTLSGSADLRWSNPHALVHDVPHLTTGLAVGLLYTRAPPQAAITVDTLSGPVDVAVGTNPVRTGVPWSLEAGWDFDDVWSTTLSVSNRVPTLLADPGGTFRAMPATTAFGLSVGASL